MDDTSTQSAFERRRAQIFEMSDRTILMLKAVRDAFVKQDLDPLGIVAKLVREVHQYEKAILHEVSLNATGSKEPLDDVVAFVPMHLERISHNVEALAGATRRMIEERVLFTDRAAREISGLLSSELDLVECLRDAAQTRNRVLIRHVAAEGQRFEARANDYALFHQQRLIEGVCQPRASSLYLALLDHLKGVEWHVRQIAQKLGSRQDAAEARRSQ